MTLSVILLPADITVSSRVEGSIRETGYLLVTAVGVDVRGRVVPVLAVGVAVRGRVVPGLAVAVAAGMRVTGVGVALADGSGVLVAVAVAVGVGVALAVGSGVLIGVGVADPKTLDGVAVKLNLARSDHVSHTSPNASTPTM